jgi:hypothetical protein
MLSPCITGRYSLSLAASKAPIFSFQSLASARWLRNPACRRLYTFGIRLYICVREGCNNFLRRIGQTLRSGGSFPAPPIIRLVSESRWNRIWDSIDECSIPRVSSVILSNRVCRAQEHLAGSRFVSFSFNQTVVQRLSDLPWHTYGGCFVEPHIVLEFIQQRWYDQTTYLTRQLFNLKIKGIPGNWVWYRPSLID